MKFARAPVHGALQGVRVPDAGPRAIVDVLGYLPQDPFIDLVQAGGAAFFVPGLEDDFSRHLPEPFVLVGVRLSDVGCGVDIALLGGLLDAPSLLGFVGELLGGLQEIGKVSRLCSPLFRGALRSCSLLCVEFRESEIYFISDNLPCLSRISQSRRTRICSLEQSYPVVKLFS